MATYTSYHNFVQAMLNEEIDLFGTTDTLNIVIHSDAGVQTTDTVLSNLTQVTGTGYTAGGADIQNDSTRTTNVVTVTAVDVVWTATAADWTAGRYFSIYDDSSTPTDNVLMCFFDYGANFTPGNGETVTADFGASLCTITGPA